MELKENQVVGVAASCHGTGSSPLFLKLGWLQFRGCRGCLDLFDDFQEMCFKGVFTSSVRLTRYVEASVKMKKSMDPALGHNGYRDIDLHRFA